MEKAGLERRLRELPGRTLNHTIFVLANRYSDTAGLLERHVLETGDADFLGPTIVNLGFSIELLLKFFIIVAEPGLSYAELRGAGVEAHGHPLSTLFDRVRPDFQVNIANEYGRAVGRKQTSAEFRAALVATGDKPFVDWRYPFESSATRFFDLEAVKQICNALGMAAQAERRRLVAQSTAVAGTSSPVGDPPG